MSQAAQLPPQPAVKDRNRYQSPPPPPSSMTPPPSSRAPLPSYPIARTPTPTQSHLSSPPPTVKTPPPHQALLEPGTPSRASDDLANASHQDLRSMLADATAECRAAKASAAHHRLQYELISFEFSEAVKRFDVELDMARKEVEVLQQAQSQAQGKIETPKSMNNGVASSASPSDHTVLDLKNHIRLLDMENESINRRLSDAKMIIMEREGLLSEENERLRRRIRENREHFNHLRQYGSIFGGDQSPQSAYHTPYTGATRRAHDAQFTTPSKSRNEEPFAALLLADQVLSQEAATTPSTPISKPAKRQQTSHVRGSHSVSSLPSTPFRSSLAPSATRASAPYYTQPQLASSPLRNAPSSSHRHRRRESRDSTISASEIDERTQPDHEADRVSDSEDEGQVTSPSISGGDGREVYESQASQEAANMLRKSSSFPRQQRTPTRPKSGKVGRPSATSSSPTAAKDGPGGRGSGGSGSGMVQSKMYGYQIAKPGASGEPEAIKRRFYDDGDGPKPSSKKARLESGGGGGTGAGAGAAVGLGIGGWADGLAR